MAGASCFLSACGGGGGGVSSTPTPAPSSVTPTPTPVSQNITLPPTSDLANVPAHANANYDLVANKVLDSDSAQGTLQVHYDAATHTYSLTSGARSATFGIPDIHAGTGAVAGETRYVYTAAGGISQYLTLAVKPYSGSRTNSYVGLGYWETIQVNNGKQNSQLDMFAYGFETSAAAVPKSGAASYDIDALALVAVPGQEPKALQGGGTLDVDFLSGSFLAQAYVDEYGLGASNTYGHGGNIVLHAGGHLASGNSFSGNVSYTGFLAANPGVSFSNVSGTIQGRFFGPNAEELGASFVAGNSDGAHVAGALTGQRNTTSPATLAISNLLADTTLNSRASELRVHFDTTSGVVFKDASGYAPDTWWQPGKVTLKLNGDVAVQTTYNVDPKATFTSADRSAVQKPNFTSFDTNKATQPSSSEPATVHFDLYKIGKDNPELQLSYVGFGIWSQTYTGSDPVYTHTTSRTDSYQYVLYGLETPKLLMAGRTGSASYQGVVYGNSVIGNGTLQEVGGTSRFNVDFGAQSYSGALDLTVGAVGGPKSTLGTWTFSDRLIDGQMGPTALSPNVATFNIPDANTINPRFYGPEGQEIGATFSIVRSMTTPDIMGGYSKISITGVTVAKRP